MLDVDDGIALRTLLGTPDGIEDGCLVGTEVGNDDNEVGVLDGTVDGIEVAFVGAHDMHSRWHHRRDKRRLLDGTNDGMLLGNHLALLMELQMGCPSESG